MDTNKTEYFHSQLNQVFEYAEILHRLNQSLELLNPRGGYMGERRVYDSIVQTKDNIKGLLKVHLKNSGLSQEAIKVIHLIIQDNYKDELNAKYSVGFRFDDGEKVYRSFYEVIATDNYTDNKGEINYFVRSDGHDGIRHHILTEEDIDEIIKKSKKASD